LASDLPENAIKMSERLKSYFVGDLAHAAIAGEQERFRFFDPDSRDVLGKR
jgi:hypothetical protein